MVRCSLLLVGFLWLAACGPTLQVIPRDHDLTLAGTWTMPAVEQARLVAELRTAVEQSQRRDDKRIRRQRREEGLQDDSNSDTPATDMHWIQQDREKDLVTLIRAVVPSEKLVVEQRTPDTLDFKPANAAVRHFDTRNSSTLMTSIATLHVVSGWQDKSFMVISRDASQGMTITEHYQRRGAVMMVTVALAMPDVKLNPLSTSYRLEQ